MTRPKTLTLALVLVGSSAALLVWHAARVEAQRELIAVARTANVYSAKFLCGEFQLDPANIPGEGPVKPGNYQTAINVHNPNSLGVAFDKKAVLVFDSTTPDSDFEVPKPPGEKVEAKLPPDWGMEIDCADIRNHLLEGAAPEAPSFIKGWVVIEAPSALSLDVVAAYTAHGLTVDVNGELKPEGFSLEVLPITPKRVKRPSIEPRPFCGDGVVNHPTEQCDPPGSPCPDGQLCNDRCACPPAGGDCPCGKECTLNGQEGRCRPVAGGPANVCECVIPPPPPGPCEEREECTGECVTPGGIHGFCNPIGGVCECVALLRPCADRPVCNGECFDASGERGQCRDVNDECVCVGAAQGRGRHILNR